MNAIVGNGFLVFQTDYFSDYIVADTGNSITLDTANYQMPVGGKYQESRNIMRLECHFQH